MYPRLQFYLIPSIQRGFVAPFWIGGGHGNCKITKRELRLRGAIYPTL